MISLGLDRILIRSLLDLYQDREKVRCREMRIEATEWFWHDSGLIIGKLGQAYVTFIGVVVSIPMYVNLITENLVQNSTLPIRRQIHQVHSASFVKFHHPILLRFDRGIGAREYWNNDQI